MAGRSEADEVLLLSVRQAVAVPTLTDDVKTCADVTTEVLFDACRCCVALIDDGFAAEPLPAQASQRFRACVDLADAVVRLGYEGKLGFQQFLYPSTNDTRALLGFLAGRLPKAATSAGGAGADAVGLAEAASLGDLAEAALRRAVKAGPQTRTCARPFWHETDAARAASLSPRTPLFIAPTALHFAAADAARAQAREEQRIRRLAAGGQAASPLPRQRRRRAASLASETPAPRTPPRARTPSLAEDGAAANTAATPKIGRAHV